VSKRGPSSSTGTRKEKIVPLALPTKGKTRKEKHQEEKYRNRRMKKAARKNKE
jgi:hypothetical protein